MYEFIHLMSYSFLHKLKTGNIIVDAIISAIFVYGISQSHRFNIKKGYEYLMNIYQTNHNEIILSCNETKCIFSGDIKMNGSDAFKSILYDIQRNLKLNKTKYLNKMKEFCIKKNNVYYDDEKDTNDIKLEQLYYLMNQSSYFLLLSSEAKDLYFSMEIQDLENEKKDKTIKIYNLKIYSPNKSIKDIQEYVDYCYMQYISKMNDEFNHKQYIFMYEGYNQSMKTLDYTMYPFETTCNINTIYFDNKDKIMSQIDFFIKNKQWYINNGKPYTLGICSYGEPGCGKTSFEKSLAKYLNRHLIIVDLSKIKSQYEADQIFFSETIEDKKIPYDKRIYLFPDVDAMHSILKKRKNKLEHITNQDRNIVDFLKHMKENNQNIKVEDIFKEMEKTHVLNNPENEYALNLSKFLNIIDGIPERTGQILIFNTNYPENIDDAVLRPGRIDCLIHFQKMNVENMVQMLSNFFKNQIHTEGNYEYIQNNRHEIEKKLSSIHRKWTPAELFKICSEYNDIHLIIDALLK